MEEQPLQIYERNEAGLVTASYIQSSFAGTKANSRVDVVLPEKKVNTWRSLLNVFLPAGYPHSVTKDYLEYQIYDSLQAFSSSIAGLLSSRAVLEGVGVGDASASPTAALLLSVLQESMGRIATILFAHKLGTSLEPECKMYRLAADVFNDTAMVLDCLSPALPKVFRVLLLSFSSVLRALCGVAAGSSKASLSAHFAKWGNLGELNAKDSSQETIISLMGMLVGSLLISHITTPFATWTSLILLLLIHLAMNYAAVRAVSMQTLNQRRANIVFSNLYLEDRMVFTPEMVAKQERIFDWTGLLRWHNGVLLGKCQIGVELKVLLEALGGETHKQTGSIRGLEVGISQLLDIFKDEEYILWYDAPRATVLIVLKQGATAISQLKAWAHALIVVMEIREHPFAQVSAEEAEILLGGTLKKLSEKFTDHVARLKAAGWDVDIAALETRSGSRISFDA